MSRGGRGGGRGGHGSSVGKLNGAALPFDVEEGLEAAYARLSEIKPKSVGSDDRYPEINVPIADPPTAREKKVVAHYRALRARIHDGPFYAVIDPNARVSKSGKRSAPAARFNPFDDVATYCAKHVRKSRVLPKLSTRPFVKTFFPKELWSTIDPAGSENADPNAPKKKLALSTTAKIDKLARFDDAADGVNGDTADEADEAMNNDNDDQAEVEEPQDDDFEEDEDDFGDDYNAEQYFDGGDDDHEDGGGDDAGGDEGY